MMDLMMTLDSEPQAGLQRAMKVPCNFKILRLLYNRG